MTEVRHVKFSELVSFLPKQKAALEAVKTHKYTLYGGARGPGKSYWLRWMLVFLLLMWRSRGLKGVRVGLFSVDYPTLKDRQLAKVKVEFPRWLGTMNESAHEFTLRPVFGSGVICFRNLDDPSKYASAEFAAIAVEELTENLVEVFNTLRGSLRWPGVSDPKFLAATNPGRIGHLWVKQYWIDSIFPPEMESLRHEFAFVPALPKDNPYLDEDYYRDLEAQPEQLRRAWLSGDWSVFEGMVFAEWMKELHVINKRVLIPRYWRWVAGLDWGRAKPGCFLLCACGPEGDIIAVDEFYFNAGAVKQHAKAVGFDVGTMVREYPINLEFIAADEQMWYETGGSGKNLAEEFIEGLFDAYGGPGTAGVPGVVEATHGRGSRRTKLDLMHRYLAWTALKPTDEGYASLLLRPGVAKPGVQVINGDWLVPPWGRPRLRYGEKCRASIRTIPALPHDKTDVEDVDTDSEDHAYDTVCNVLMARPPLPEMPRQPPEADRHPGIARGGRKKPRDPDEEGEALTRSAAGRYRMARSRDLEPYEG